MSKYILGLDLGTSGVKLICRSLEGKVFKLREGYKEQGCKAWWESIKKVIIKLTSDIDPHCIEAIGLSCQTGTYIFDKDRHIIWNEGVGREELAGIKSYFSQEEFLQEISMPHPDIISYPMPRLLYIKNKYKYNGDICALKDYICQRLTGNTITDKFTWRGLVNLDTGEYSRKLLDHIKITINSLPPVACPTDLAGNLSEDASRELGLLQPVKVFTGCNDFFASLLGMGIWDEGIIFDITGTSEHIGMICNNTDVDTKLVCGPYFNKNVNYGVTASSGVSMDFALSLYNGDMDINDVLQKKPPVFLPYLNGERAPIWDADARGVFFGLNSDINNILMAYSIKEGIVFSLYHIFENLLENKNYSHMIISGGASSDICLNMLKSTLFEVPVSISCESETSALGACMLACVGAGWYKSILEAMNDLCNAEYFIQYKNINKNTLMERFKIYKELYPTLKDNFKMLKYII